MDEFSSALQQLLSVHQAQVSALTSRLEAEQRERKELKQRVESLQTANDEASKVIRNAKIKIKQQAKVVEELKVKLQDSVHNYRTTPSTALVVSQAAEVATPTTASDRRKLDQTCAALFESPAHGEVDRSHDTVAPRGEEPAATAGGGEEGEMDYHRGESVETVGGDVVVVEPVEDEHSQSQLQSQSSSGRGGGGMDEQTDSMFNSSLPLSGPVHMVYSHAHTCQQVVSPFEDRQACAKSNTSTAGSRSLSLREGASSKVKWRENPVSASSSASETRLSPSPNKITSPTTHTSDSECSSSPEQLSPSLLGASNSPWKLQRSNANPVRFQQQPSTPANALNASPSLFARTPVAGYPDDGGGPPVFTTPVSSLKPAIPQSDSQFSLDVSQSIPPSPELRPQTHRQPIAAKKLVSASSFTPHGVGRSVVPITPGVLSVDKILGGGGGERWMAVGRESGDKANPLAGKRELERVDFEDEDLLPRSKVNRLTSRSVDVTVGEADDDQTMLHEPASPQREEQGEEGESEAAVSPVMLYRTSSAMPRKNGSVATTAATRHEGKGGSLQLKHKKQDHGQQRLLERAGLPEYPCAAVIRKKADRDKLQGKACPDCEAWFAKGDGIHDDVEGHLKQTCRHKHLHLPPDEDSRIWNMSFPATEECERIMDRK